jgi:hypothetical protein
LKWQIHPVFDLAAQISECAAKILPGQVNSDQLAGIVDNLQQDGTSAG